MANIRNAVLVSDFSCKDTYCDTSSGENKLLKKKTYHISDQAGTAHDPTSTGPLVSSIPVNGNGEVIIAEGGIIKELFDDCALEWEATYTDCTTLTWIQKSLTLNDINTSSDVPLNCAGLTI